MSITIRSHSEADATALGPLWRTARTADGADAPDAAGWRWRFESAPGAIAGVVAVDESGALRATAHAIPAAMQVGDERVRWAQTTGVVDGADDEALSAAFRELIATKGGMGEAVNTFFDLHTERAGRVPRDHAGFETVRNQNRLMLAAERASAAPDGVRVIDVEGWSDGLADLLATPPPGERAWRVRDRAWFEWRFLAHPEAPYRLRAALRGDRFVGFAAARTAVVSGEAATWAVDWWQRSPDHAVSSALTAALAADARAAGVARVGWVLADTDSEWIVLQELDARIEPTPWFLDVRTFSRRTTDRWLQQHWVYTLADFDLI